jgi:hypothetical protein
MNRRSSSFIRSRYTQAIGTMFNWIRNLLVFTVSLLAGFTLGPMLGVDAADAPSSPVYVVKGAGQLRQRDSKSLRPLRADRADAVACERNGMLEYWNIEILGSERIDPFFHSSIFPLFQSLMHFR